MSLWSKHYTDTLIVHSYQGSNDYGDTIFDPPLSGDGATIKCRVEYNRKEVLDKDGNKVISEAMVYSDVSIAPLSIVHVDGQQYVAKSCQPIKDLYGRLDHYETYL